MLYIKLRRWQDVKQASLTTFSSGLEKVLEAGEAAYPCHSHTLQQRTGTHLQLLVKIEIFVVVCANNIYKKKIS